LIFLTGFKRLFFNAEGTKNPELWVWLISVSITLATMAFNLSYFHLAWLYHEISREIPNIIEKKQVTEAA